MSAVVLTSLGVPSPADASTDATADVGACSLTITVSSTSDEPVLAPATTTWTLGGGGSCSIVNGDEDIPADVGGQLTGLLDLPTGGCVAGLAEGTLTLALDGDEGTTYAVNVAVAGPAVGLEGVSVNPSAVASGAFVQDPCPEDGDATWSGALVFAELAVP